MEYSYKSNIPIPNPKRPKLNPTGQNAYLAPDGSVTFDEDKIIFVQRIFKDKLYKPGGNMYKKIYHEWYAESLSDSRSS